MDDEVELAFRNGLGDRLVAIYEYATLFVVGPKAPTRRVLVLVNRIDVVMLERVRPVMDALRKQNIAVRLDTPEDVMTSADVFPVFAMEVLDSAKLLHGEDVLEGLTVESAHLRVHAEQNLRVLHRQLIAGYLGAESDLPAAKVLRINGRKAIYLLRVLAKIKGLPVPEPVTAAGVVDSVASELFPDDLDVWQRLVKFANFEDTLPHGALIALYVAVLECLGRAVAVVDGL